MRFLLFVFVVGFVFVTVDGRWTAPLKSELLKKLLRSFQNGGPAVTGRKQGGASMDWSPTGSEVDISGYYSGQSSADFSAEDLTSPDPSQSGQGDVTNPAATSYSYEGWSSASGDNGGEGFGSSISPTTSHYGFAPFREHHGNMKYGMQKRHDYTSKYNSGMSGMGPNDYYGNSGMSGMGPYDYYGNSGMSGMGPYDYYGNGGMSGMGLYDYYGNGCNGGMPGMGGPYDYGNGGMSGMGGPNDYYGSGGMSGMGGPNDYYGNGGMSGMGGPNDYYGSGGMSGMGGPNDYYGSGGMSGMGGPNDYYGSGGMSGMGGPNDYYGSGGMSGMGGPNGYYGNGGMSGMGNYFRSKKQSRKRDPAFSKPDEDKRAFKSSRRSELSKLMRLLRRKG